MKTNAICLLLIVFTLASCSKWEIFNKKGAEQNQVIPQSPTVVTGKVVDGSENYAVVSAEITDLSNDVIVQFGHCWSTSKTLPTIDDSKTSLGSRNNLGSYTSTLTDLIPNATYYVRAYAINKTGISYGATITYVAKPQNYITIISPVSTSIFKKGISNNIKWSENSSDNVKIDLMISNVVFRTIASSAPGTGVYSWTPTNDLTEAGYYSIRITSTKNALVFDETSTFTITNNSVAPTISTLPVTNISPTGATSGGTVDKDGGSTVQERGICYGLQPGVTITNSKTSEPGTLGTFSSVMSNLQPNTTYYCRAYATSIAGTGYGAEQTFKTPASSTAPVSDLPVQVSVSSTTALLKCNISGDGGATVTSRGICWSSNHNPTVADNMTNYGSGLGSFNATLTALAPNSVVYAKVFAQNSVGISYSQELTINTATPVVPNISYVSVTGGTFSMGNPTGPNSEMPVHSVILKDFNLSSTEITNSQYAHFLNEYQSSSVQYGASIGQPMVNSDTYGVTLSGSIWIAQPGFENSPIVNVSWYGAYEFCKFYGLRLPTEAEWEYAAKGGINKNTYTYSGSNNSNDVAWFYDNSFGISNPVAQKNANSLGIYDMSGNAWEWTNDWYGNYLSATQISPSGPTSGTNKVMRGGSRNSSISDLTVTKRSSAAPNFLNSTVGFRVAK